MYQHEYINPLRQFGYLSVTLISHDDAGVYPSLRVDKTFPDTISEEDMEAEALRVEAQAISDFLQGQGE